MGAVELKSTPGATKAFYTAGTGSRSQADFSQLDHVCAAGTSLCPAPTHRSPLCSHKEKTACLGHCWRWAALSVPHTRLLMVLMVLEQEKQNAAV